MLALGRAGKSRREIAETVSVDRACVDNWLGKAGIKTGNFSETGRKKNARFIAPAPRRRAWGASELALLRELWGDHDSIEDISLILSRSRKDVGAKIRELMLLQIEMPIG